MAFSTADFQKIWASTSPLTPYEFSESNYKEGWNFIGSTPPARQMWDGIQKLNDEKTQYLYDTTDPIGTVETDSISSSVSVTSGTVENITSISLDAGTWVVTGHIRFGSVTADKQYVCAIADANNTANTANDGATSVHSSGSQVIALQSTRIVALNATATIYLNAYATANCSVDAGIITAVRIK